MSRIRSRGNETTELRLARLLREWHVTGWRRGIALIGRPDFVFRQKRVAIFVDGCFWHSCPRCGVVPASNRWYWIKKLARNRERDQTVNRELEKHGWQVVRLWEHALDNPASVEKRLKRILA